MKIDTQQVRKTVAKIRSEMRYYQDRQVPNYSASATQKAMASLQEQIPSYGVKLRTEGVENLERLKVVKELNQLYSDLESFPFDGEKPSDQAAADSGSFPIVKPVQELAECLHHSQPQRKPPRVVNPPK